MNALIMVRSKYSASKVKYGHSKKKSKQLSRSTSDEDSVASNDDKKKRTYEERLRRERLSQGYDCLRIAIKSPGVSNNECLLRTCARIDSLQNKYAKTTSKCLKYNLIDSSSLNDELLKSDDQVVPEDEEYHTASDDEDAFVDVENVESDSNGAEYSKHMNAILIKGTSDIAIKSTSESDESESDYE